MMEQRQPRGIGRDRARFGSGGAAVAVALLAVAAATGAPAIARANPNAAGPPAAMPTENVGPNSTPSTDSLMGAHPVRRSDRAASVDPGVAMDTWHAQAVARLSAALEHYEALAQAGGWSTVPDGPTLEPGTLDARVALVRHRLAATGDAVPGVVSGDAAPVHLTSEATLAEFSPLVFDTTLAEGVKAFQARHGLFVDGVVGPRTLRALNVPVAARLRTQKINLERLQAFKPWGPSYVLVNVPGFEAQLIRGHEPILTTRVIVGQPDWPTPQLDGMISRVVVNPYWNVPKSILRREIIPRMQRDPGYLARENIRVFSGWHTFARELDPAAIDWSGPAAPIYRLRQEPGPQNALGTFKFAFDNTQSIYLHDTQSRRLFGRAGRALSHGCVRVERPFELAELLLAGQDRWNAAALQGAIDRGDNRWITLKRPVPVHLVYWTAWADEAGRAHFRRDIYERDWKPYARETSQQQGT